MITRHAKTPIRRPRGFTLIEAAIVTVIVGVGIVGMLELIASGSMANTQSTELTTAMGLASNIHEMTLATTYAQMFTTFDGYTKSPPVDSKGNAIAGLPNWAQSVDVKYVDPDNITIAVPDSQQTAVSRISVTVKHNNQLVYQTSWLVADGSGS